MDKASDFGSEDCRFESCHGRYSFRCFQKNLIPLTNCLDICINNNSDSKNYNRLIRHLEMLMGLQ